MPRYLMTIRFDGTMYHGWQVQKNAVSVQQTVQDAFENALSFRPGITGCSRTDSGVHANKYCFHFDLENDIAPKGITAALNSKLPKDICAVDCNYVPDDFHARYGVLKKRYVYRIYTGKIRDPFLFRYSYHCKRDLNADIMNKAAEKFIGKYDFSSFCASGSSVEDNTRTVFSATVSKKGDIIEFAVEADGFLYNMVRIMAGTLIDVGAAKLSPSDIPMIIAKKDRSAAGATAPAQGLFLDDVIY